MVNYIIRRAITMLLVLFLSSIAIFFILNAAPGGPLDGLRLQTGNPNAAVSAEDFARLENLLGLDKPAHLRYIVWMFGDDWIEVLPVWFTDTDFQGNPFENGDNKGVLRGDWGESWAVSRNNAVMDVIQARFGNTVILIGSAVVVSLLIAVPIGILSAVKQYSTLDYAATTFSFIGISMPIFWLGLIMIILFSLKFKEWGLPSLPSGGVFSLRGANAGTIPDRIIHLIMPVGALAMLYMAGWSRFMRTSMLDVLGQDYVKVARAKGLRERVVVAKHAFRNALIPLITIVTLQLPTLFGGAVLTETVFAYNGLGRLFFDAIGRSDWPVVQGYLLILAVLVVISNLIADLAYVVVDPRIRFS